MTVQTSNLVHAPAHNVTHIQPDLLPSEIPRPRWVKCPCEGKPEISMLLFDYKIGFALSLSLRTSCFGCCFWLCASSPGPRPASRASRYPSYNFAVDQWPRRGWSHNKISYVSKQDRLRWRENPVLCPPEQGRRTNWKIIFKFRYYHILLLNTIIFWWS